MHYYSNSSTSSFPGINCDDMELPCVSQSSATVWDSNTFMINHRISELEFETCTNDLKFIHHEMATNSYVLFFFGILWTSHRAT